jgi:hypothetical protein
MCLRFVSFDFARDFSAIISNAVSSVRESKNLGVLSAVKAMTCQGITLNGRLTI